MGYIEQVRQQDQLVVDGIGTSSVFKPLVSVSGNIGTADRGKETTGEVGSFEEIGGHLGSDQANTLISQKIDQNKGVF